MVDTKISGLPAATSVTAADEFAMNDAGTSRKATASQIRDFVGYDGFAYRRAVGSFWMLPMYPAAASAVGAALTLNAEYAQPIVVTRSGGQSITAVSINVNTAITSAAVRIGLRTTDPLTGLPGTLLTEFTSAGALAAATTGTKTVTMAAAYTLPEGLSWLTIKSDTAAANLSYVQASHPAVQKFNNTATGPTGAYTAAAGSAGALPSAAPAWNASTNINPHVWLTLA